MKCKREARPRVTLLKLTEPQKIRPAPGTNTQSERKSPTSPTTILPQELERRKGGTRKNLDRGSQKGGRNLGEA